MELTRTWVPAPFKGIVSRDEYFVEGHKNQNSAVRMSVDGFLPIFGLSFCEENPK
jgi:hypothetical protein